VLFEFEVREAADPVNVANFKFGTLGVLATSNKTAGAKAAFASREWP
jgi:hypothetical protein